MNVTYTWTIDNFHVIPHLDGLDNIIQRVSWALIGTTVGTDEKTYEYRYDATTTIKLDSSASFIPAGELNPDIIQEWVFNIENKKQRNIDWIKTNIIEKRLDEQFNPAIAKITKPFWEQ